MKYIKCTNCGAMVKVEKDCTCDDCGIQCCGQTMVEIVPNSVDASFEKHIPTYTVNGENIEAVVNHVMEDEHYIMWIELVSPKLQIRKCFAPNEEAKATFPYIKGSKLLDYCNKHGIWEKDVE